MSLDSDWMERREEAKEQGEGGGGSGDGEWAKGEGEGRGSAGEGKPGNGKGRWVGARVCLNRDLRNLSLEFPVKD